MSNLRRLSGADDEIGLYIGARNKSLPFVRERYSRQKQSFDRRTAFLLYLVYRGPIICSLHHVHKKIVIRLFLSIPSQLYQLDFLHFQCRVTE